MSDWANLPTDISILVVGRLAYLEDFFSMGVVCKSWKSVTSMFEKMPALRPRTPLVLLPEGNKPCKNGIRRFHSLSDMKTYEFELPEAAGRKCLGTLCGWLLTVDSDFNANLLHPFARQQIAMPPLFALKNNQFEYADFNLPTTQVLKCSSLVKLAMSRNPLEENARKDCVVVSIVRGFPLLAVARLGDRVWTSIISPSEVYYDVMHCEGVFYAVDGNRVLFICDVSKNENAPIAITAPIRTRGRRQMYLVESSGDILLVCRRRQIRGRCVYSELYPQNSSPCPTIGFSVYKLGRGHVGGYPCGWIKVKELGGRALFLGGNMSMSLCSSNHVKADCIYFLEDEPEMYPGGFDTGIYNMKGKIIEPLFGASPFCVLNPPVWCI